MDSSMDFGTVALKEAHSVEKWGADRKEFLLAVLKVYPAAALLAVLTENEMVARSAVLKVACEVEL